MICDIISEFLDVVKTTFLVIVIAVIIIVIIVGGRSIGDSINRRRRESEHQQEIRKNLDRLKLSAKEWSLQELYEVYQEAVYEIEKLEDSMKKTGWDYARETIFLLVELDIDALREFRNYLKLEITRRNSNH